jgi:Family of unknown function (DUF5691)
MNTWQNLKSTALLGTDKMPFEAKVLPESLQKVLEKVPKNDPEGYFLKAAALSYTYQKAGQSPARATLPEISIISEETQMVCPPQAVEVWRSVLDEEHFNPYLFEYLTDVCIQKNWIIPQNVLTNALNKCPKNQLSKIHQIIGKRGQWLTQFNANWQIKGVSEVQTDIWEEGKPVERKQFFAQERTDNPAEALDLFKKSWNEESAKDRKDLLGLLSINLSKNDEEFLDEKYQELSTGKAADKPITLETTQLINQLRLGIDGSTFGKEIFEKIISYVEKKKGLLASVGLGSGSWTLNLPKTEDDFWNGNAMNKAFGFDKLTVLQGFTDAEYWFGALIKHLNPNYWIRFFENDIKKMVSFFTETESVKRKGTWLFINPLSQAMDTASPSEIALFLAMTPSFAQQTTWIPLFKKINPEQAEMLLIQDYHNELNGNILKDILETVNHDFSPKFSGQIIKILAQDLQKNSYYLLSEKNFINLLGRRLSGDVPRYLREHGTQIAPGWQSNFWQSTFTDNLLRQVDKKNEIQKLKI